MGHKVLYTFALSLIFSRTVHCMSISHIDVGQGNCTLVLPEKVRSPILLIDCGSSSNKAHAASNSNNREELTETIENLVMTYAGANTTAQEMIIIISHADDDHYNLLTPLIHHFLKNIRIINLKQIIFGGEREDYTGRVLWGMKRLSFSDFLNKLETTHGVSILFPCETVTDCNVLKPINRNYNFIVLFIPKTTKFQRKKKNIDKNTMSLIVQVSFADKKALIQGDATDITTDFHLRTAHQSSSSHATQPSQSLSNYNLSTLQVSDLSTDILLASHHGSSSGCNGSKWLKQMSAKFIILSSGVDTQYRHPREDTVKNCLEILQDDSGPLHSLYFGLQAPRVFDKNQHIDYHGEFCDGYGVTFTKRNLYGTIGQGTITFLFRRGKAIDQPTCSRPYSIYAAESVEEAILLRCNPNSSEGKNLRLTNRLKPLKDPCLSFDFLICINLSKIDFSQPGLKNSARKLFEHLLNSNHKIQAIYLDDTELGKNIQLFEILKKIVEKKKKISLLSIKDSLHDSSQITSLQTSWGYRGLTTN